MARRGTGCCALPLPAAPVYLWGSGGCGKTHLLQALAARCQAAGQQVGWFDASDRPPWVLSPAWALVVVDRCEALDEAAQHAAFALFEDATAHGVQWLAAGRLPPIDLPLRDDLKTRLAWGHVFAMQPLPDADTRAALRRFFEVDRHHVVLAALQSLADAGRVPREVLEQAIARYSLDPDAGTSWEL